MNQVDDHCFIFLKDEYPDWCQKCEKMEKRIMDGDGIGAITICGKIAEQISKEICVKTSLDDLCSESQYDRNNELKNQGIITSSELKLYNQIRVKRNYGIHDDEKIKNEMADAYRNHENLYKISTKFYKDYIDSDYDFPKYKQPKSAFSQDTVIEQHTNSHNSYAENSNNTVNITNINHNYSQKEMKAENKEVHIDNKPGEKDAMDKKTLVFGIVAIVAILVIALAFFGTVMNNTSSDLQGTSQVSSSSGDSAQVSSSVNNSSEKSVTGSSDAKSGTVYWASVKTNSFHKPSCEWAQKISDDNKIVFHSRQDALNSGRQPCEVCNP